MCVRTTWIWSGRAWAGSVPANALLAVLTRAIAVGPMARLELIQKESAKAADNADPERVIESHIAAQRFSEMAFREGEMLLVTPRRAKVFLEQAVGI